MAMQAHRWRILIPSLCRIQDADMNRLYSIQPYLDFLCHLFSSQSHLYHSTEGSAAGLSRQNSCDTSFGELSHEVSVECWLAGGGAWPGANMVLFQHGTRSFLKYADRRKVASELRVGTSTSPLTPLHADGHMNGCCPRQRRFVPDWRNADTEPPEFASAWLAWAALPSHGAACPVR